MLSEFFVYAYTPSFETSSNQRNVPGEFFTLKFELDVYIYILNLPDTYINSLEVEASIRRSIRDIYQLKESNPFGEFLF